MVLWANAWFRVAIVCLLVVVTVAWLGFLVVSCVLLYRSVVYLLVALGGWVGVCRICEWPIDSLLHGLEFDKWDVDYVQEGSFPFEVRFWQMWCVSYEFSLRVDWERFVVVFVVSVFVPFSYSIFYDCSFLGSIRYCYHDRFVWGSYALVCTLVGGVFWQCHFVCGKCDSEMSAFHGLKL